MKRLAAVGSAFFGVGAVILAQLELSGNAAFMAWGAFLIGLGLLSLCWFVMGYRCYQHLNDTPTARVATAPQGYIELNGLAENLEGHPQQAPLTRQRCVWYRYSVAEKRRSGKNTRWVTIDSGESSVGFTLKDETGTALVMPAGAEIHPTTHRQWYGDTSSPAMDMIPSSSSFFSVMGRYRYEESVLLEGFPVHVAGWFETLRPTANIEKELNETLREWKSDPALMRGVADLNEDGDVDLAEWDTLRERARKKIMAAHAGDVNTPVHTLSVPADSGSPYLISGQGEERAVAHYRRVAMAGAAGFVACATGGAYLLSRVAP